MLPKVSYDLYVKSLGSETEKSPEHKIMDLRDRELGKRIECIA